MIWLFFCLLVACVYPVYDGRDVLWKAMRLAWDGLSGKRGRTKEVVDVQQERETGSEASLEKTASQTVKAG